MAVVPTSRVGFQSTLPARGATYSNMESALTSGISIHAPRTGSDGCGGRVWVLPDISIHAPRTGSDLGSKLLQVQINISIHAPRTGSDFTPAIRNP